MRVGHRLLNRRVAEYFLQREDVATVHHKVAGERMAKYVGGLPFGQIEIALFKLCVELGIAIFEQSARFACDDFILQFLAGRHRAVFPVLGIEKSHFAMTDRAALQLFRFAPVAKQSLATL